MIKRIESNITEEQAYRMYKTFILSSVLVGKNYTKRVQKFKKYERTSNRIQRKRYIRLNKNNVAVDEL